MITNPPIEVSALDALQIKVAQLNAAVQHLRPGVKADARLVHERAQHVAKLAAQVVCEAHHHGS